MYNLQGAYKKSGKVIYRLHPCVKLLFSLVFVVTAGLTGNAVVFAILTVVLFLCGYAADVAPLPLLNSLRPFRFLLIFTFIVQLFITADGHWAAPNGAAFGNSALFTLKMALMIGFSALFAFITPPIDIVRIFYLLFQPLRIIKISPAETALSMLIALRFIPLLFAEGEKIIDSQRIKGILPCKGERGGGLMLIMRSASLIVPLFARVFYYASQIGITLQYRKHDDNFFRLSRLSPADFAFATLFMLAGAVLTVADNVL